MNQNRADINPGVTETPSALTNLEKMSVKELITAINKEDAHVHKAIHDALPQIERLISAVYESMLKGGRLFYVGAGTSGRLGVLDAAELPPTYGVSSELVIGIIAGGDKALRKSVENAEDDKQQAWEDLKAFNIGKHDSIIGIAASGTTPYVIGCIEKAKAEGLLTGCITCNPGSLLAKTAEYAVEAVAGPEFIAGSTRMKAGTAQKMILNMISTTLMIKLGKVEGNKMVNMQLNNKKLVNRGTRMIMEELDLDYESARELLLKYKSVKKVLDALRAKHDM
jgi:N-acetylmuramic acid 6-phosphate etherase